MALASAGQEAVVSGGEVGNALLIGLPGPSHIGLHSDLALTP